jgi:hypothetical protein
MKKLSLITLLVLALASSSHLFAQRRGNLCGSEECKELVRSIASSPLVLFFEIVVFIGVSLSLVTYVHGRSEKSTRAKKEDDDE